MGCTRCMVLGLSLSLNKVAPSLSTNQPFLRKQALVQCLLLVSAVNTTHTQASSTFSCVCYRDFQVHCPRNKCTCALGILWATSEIWFRTQAQPCVRVATWSWASLNMSDDRNVQVSPIQVGNNGAGVSVTVNSCISPVVPTQFLCLIKASWSLPSVQLTLCQSQRSLVKLFSKQSVKTKDSIWSENRSEKHKSFNGEYLSALEGFY